MKTEAKSTVGLRAENAELRGRLEEAEETLRAIRAGEVDAMVVGGQVYSLSGAETPYRRLIESINEGAATLTSDTTVLYCNHRLAQLLHCPMEEVVGSTLRRFVIPSDLPAFDALLAQGGRGFAHGEIHLLHPGFPAVPVELSLSVFESDGTRAICVVVRDIRERKHAEAALRQANRALRTISSCNKALIQATTENGLLAEVCRVIVEEGGYRLAWVGYAENDARKTVRPMASAGYEAGYLERVNITWADEPRGQGPTGTAIRTRQPAVCRDTHTDPHFAPWRDDAVKRGYGASSVLPLLDQGTAFGALSIYAIEANAFAPEEVKLLEELAEDLVFGILALRSRLAHREAAEALRRALAYNRSLIEGSLDPLATIGLDGRIVDVNAATEKATGRSRAELIGTDFSDYFTEPGKARDGYMQVLRDGLIRDYPLELRHRDGRITSVVYNATVYRDEHGAVIGVFAAARDITELKRAEAEVRALNATLEQRVTERTRELATSEERLRSVLRATATGTFEIDLQTGEGRWNEVEYELLGLKPGEVPPVPATFLRYVHPDDIGPLNEKWEQAKRTGELGAEFRVVRADGQLRWLAGKGHFVQTRPTGGGGVSGGQPERFLGVNYDITGRKLAEQALRESEQRLALAVDAAKEGVWDWDMATGRLEWSPQQFRMFGLDPARTGASFDAWRGVIHPADRAAAEAQIQTAIAQRTRLENEYRVVLPSGEIRWIGALGDAIYDASGHPLRMSGVCLDITARKRAEIELRNMADKLQASNRELESFSYSVSHDLRAPLRSIDGFSRIVLEDCGDKLDAEGRDNLLRVRAATQRMGELIDDLLKLSRVVRTDIRCRTLDVSALAREALRQLQQAEPARQVECRVEPGLRATADRSLLCLVLENLLGNAWKFTARRAGARIEVGAIEHEGERAFFVRDNGAGFAAVYADQLFSPFRRLHTQAEFPGHGIGLATVQRIIHRHGGRVWAEGKVDEGAAFYFTLPDQPKNP